MAFELWLAFAIASTALLAIPGPSVTLVVSYVLRNARHNAWASVSGVVLGDFAAITLSLLGTGAILQASANLFILMKLAGAAYLMWLGIKLWLLKPEISSPAQINARASKDSIFWNSFIVTALNPKGIIFFVAFIPQFIDPARRALIQFAIMEITFLALAAINIFIWVILAHKLSARLKQPSTMRLVNRIGGSFLIGAGMMAAISRPNL